MGGPFNGALSPIGGGPCRGAASLVGGPNCLGGGWKLDGADWVEPSAVWAGCSRLVDGMPCCRNSTNESFKNTLRMPGYRSNIINSCCSPLFRGCVRATSHFESKKFARA